MKKQELTLTDIKKTLNTKVKEQRALRKKYETAVSNDIKQLVHILKDLVVNSDGIEAIRWAQYTPYYNDGEPCEFDLADLQIKFDPVRYPTSTEEWKNLEHSEGFISFYELDKWLEKAEDILNFKELEKLEKKIRIMNDVHAALTSMSDAMRTHFGDHAQVVVTKKGIEVEKYDHD